MTTLTNLIKWVTQPKICISVLWYYLACEYLFLLYGMVRLTCPFCGTICHI